MCCLLVCSPEQYMAVSGQVLREADSEMEICMQETKWGMNCWNNTCKGVREVGWAEEEGELRCKYSCCLCTLLGQSSTRTAFRVDPN